RTLEPFDVLGVEVVEVVEVGEVHAHHQGVVEGRAELGEHRREVRQDSVRLLGEAAVDERAGGRIGGHLACHIEGVTPAGGVCERADLWRNSFGSSEIEGLLDGHPAASCIALTKRAVAGSWGRLITWSALPSSTTTPPAMKTA